MAFYLYNNWIGSERKAARRCVKWAEGGSEKGSIAARLRRKFRERRRELLRWAKRHSVPPYRDPMTGHILTLQPGRTVVLDIKVNDPYEPPPLDEEDAANRAAEALFFEVFFDASKPDPE